MRLGATRYGPSAPDAFQLGKYDALTSTGLPTWSTSNEILLSPVSMFETSTSATGRASGCSPTRTRCQSAGPLAARGTSHRVGSVYQRMAGPPNRRDSSSGCSTQSTWLLVMPVTTAGSFSSPVTTSLFATSKMTHGPDLAISVRSGWLRAWLMAFSDVAM